MEPQNFIRFTTTPCRPWADKYHEGHARLSTHIQFQNTFFKIVNSIRIHCEPTEEPVIVYSVIVKPIFCEIDL